MILESARLALAAVLLIGGFGKLTDQKASRAAVAEFGIPASAAGALGWALIGAELVTATALLFGPSYEWAAAGALVLLTIVSAAMAANLIRGRTPECHCFGRLSRGPVGWSTLARNGVLAAVAGYVATSGRAPAPFLGLALLSGAAWLALSASRPRVRGGAIAPGFSLADTVGTRWTLESLLGQARPVLLVFSQPGCGACQALLSDLPEWHVRLGDRLTIAVISQSWAASHFPATGVAHPAPEQIGYPALVDPMGAAASAYGVAATPSAVLIEPDGRMAAPIALGAGQIDSLVTARFQWDDDPRLPRRAVILRAARGATTLGAFPLLAAACGSSHASSSASSATQAKGATAGRPQSLRVAGTYICHQPYALCTDAACRPSPKDQSIVICDCVVKHGYSVGVIPCPRRAPNGTKLYSTFSTELVTSSTRAMTCGAHIPWANCVDAPCQLDPSDPNKATCQCPVVKQGPSFTLGGDCNTRTCGKTVWSGAHTTLGGNAVAAAMKRVGQPLATPVSCPKS